MEKQGNCEDVYKSEVLHFMSGIIPVVARENKEALNIFPASPSIFKKLLRRFSPVSDTESNEEVLRQFRKERGERALYKLSRAIVAAAIENAKEIHMYLVTNPQATKSNMLNVTRVLFNIILKNDEAKAVFFNSTSISTEETALYIVADRLFKVVARQPHMAVFYKENEHVVDKLFRKAVYEINANNAKLI
ncbi:MAG: hypothetical protein ACP5RP_03755 [Candidatus Micrarchaeia archaeon]